MIKYYFILLAFCWAMNTPAQTTSYEADLDALYALLKQTPSYKDQIRGNRQQAFEAVYDSLRRDTVHANNGFERFYKLAHLFFPIRDNHMGFNQFPDRILKQADFRNEEAIQQYRANSYFKDYPAVILNLDSLQASLATKAMDAVEGIYYYDHYLTIGVYRTINQHELVGVVLNTSLPHWEKGQIAVRLYEYLPNCFRAIYGHPLHKYLQFYSNEKYRNHSLVNAYFYSSLSATVYKKDTSEIDYTAIKESAPTFQFRQLNAAIQYMRLGSFSAMATAMETSQAFYDRINDSLTATHLIVDLRDNTGGATKVSAKFVRLIKQYARKGNVHVLINNGTMSQGEIVTLQLKRCSTVKVYGQTTKGTIAYGVNSGGLKKLPSGQYGVVLTDMKDKGHYFPYENYGVTPDTDLGNTGDWIDLVVQEIEQKLP